MANAETGITIEFRGKTTSFSNSVDGVNKALKLVSKDVKALNKELKLDPTSVDTLSNKFKALTQKQQLLTQQIQNYKNEIAKMPDVVTNDQAKKMASYLNSLSDCEIQLKKVNEELSTNSVQGAKNFGIQLEECEKTLSKISNVVGKIGQILTPLSVASGAILTSGISYNLELEKTEKALSRITGSEEEASQVMQDFIDFAGETPFSPQEMTEWVQMLMQAGTTAEETKEIITALGNAVSATGGGTDEMNRMVQNLLQFKDASPEARDLKQFQYAYIDIYGALTDYLGKNAREMEASEITYQDVVNALKKASEDGGKYANGMSTIAETTSVRIEKLKYQLEQLTGSLTETLLPIVEKIVDKLEGLMEKLSALSPETKETIANALLVTTALAPMFLAISKILSVVGGISKSVGALLKNTQFLVWLAKVKTVITNINAVIGKSKIGALLTQLASKLGIATGPLGILVALMVAIVARCQEFRQAVVDVVTAVWGIFQPIIEALISIFKPIIEWLMPILDGIVQIIGGVLAVALEALALVLEVIGGFVQDLINGFKKLWEKFKESELCDLLTEAFQKLGDVIQWVVDKVKALFDWFGSLVDRAKEFLGIQSEVQNTANSVSLPADYGEYSRKGLVVQSGGFGSNGFTLNTTINVNNNGRSITQSEVNKWADMMVDRVNDKLGRLL
jgi:phage-related protein